MQKKLVEFPTQEEIELIKKSHKNLPKELKGVLLVIEEGYMNFETYKNKYADRISQLLQKAKDEQRSIDCFINYLKINSQKANAESMIFTVNGAGFEMHNGVTYNKENNQILCAGKSKFKSWMQSSFQMINMSKQITTALSKIPDSTKTIFVDLAYKVTPEEPFCIEVIFHLSYKTTDGGDAILSLPYQFTNTKQAYQFLIQNTKPAYPFDQVLVYQPDDIDAKKMDDLLQDTRLLSAPKEWPKGLSSLVDLYYSEGLENESREGLLRVINAKPQRKTYLNNVLQERSLGRVEYLLENRTQDDFSLLLYDEQRSIVNKHITFPKNNEYMKRIIWEIERILQDNFTVKFTGWRHTKLSISGKARTSKDARITLEFSSDYKELYSYTKNISIEQLCDLIKLVCPPFEKIDNKLFGRNDSLKEKKEEDSKDDEDDEDDRYY